MRQENGMEKLKLVKAEEKALLPSASRSENRELERFKAVTKNLSEKALEIVNRISMKEMSEPGFRTELVEDYYLLHHTLDFLRRFASSKA
jgi:hypothetical protein